MFSQKIKKIVTVILGIGLLFACKSIWLSRDISIYFNSHSDKSVEYQIFYDRTDIPSFSKKHSVKKKVQGDKKVRIVLPTKKINHIRIDFGSNPGQVTISNLKLHGNKWVRIKDFSKFNFHEIDDHSFNESKDALTITSNKHDPYIIFQEKIHLKGGRTVNYRLACTILISSIVLFYLFLNYVNLLKKKENIFFLCLFVLGLVLERHFYETKGFRHFDFSIFISCCLLTYFICFKIYKKAFGFISIGINYFFRFQDKIFVCILCILLCIPASHISKATKSVQENRTLAKYYKLKNKNGLNVKYGEQFNNWFSDHFFTREMTIKKYDDLRYTINDKVENKRAFYFRKNGWMFTGYPKFRVLKQAQIEDFIHRFTEFDKFCQRNNIKLYVLVVPFKEMIYQEKIQNRYVQFVKEQNFLQMFEKITNKLGNKIIFPYNEFKRAKKNDFVFFKESHHWTEYGAYIGYKSLIKSIQQDYKNVPIVSLDDYKKSKNKLIREDWDRGFYNGQTPRVLNIKDDFVRNFILENDYVYYDPNSPIIPEIQDISRYKTKYYKNPNKKAKYKVLLSGYSNNENLLQFLPYSFREVKYYRLNNVKDVKNEDVDRFLKRYKADLLRFKPDILIFTINPEGQLFSKKLWEIN